jgi:hypothetical protein
MSAETLDAPAVDPHESRSLDSITSEAPDDRSAFDQATAGQDVENIAVDEQPTDVAPAGDSAPVEQKSWRDHLAASGFNIPQDADDEAAARLIAQNFQQTYQQAQQAQWYRQQALTLQQQQAQWQAQQQAAQQPQAPPQPEKPKKPEWNPDWAKLVRRDPETNQLVPVNPHIRPDIPEKVEAYLQWKQQQQEKWLEVDPEEFQAKAIAEAKAQAAEELNQRLAQHEQPWRQQQNVATAQQILTQQKDVLFQLDPTGNPLTDGYGNPVLSPLGQEFQQIVMGLNQLGIADPQQKAYMANAILHYNAHLNGQQVQAQQAATQQAPPSPQQAYLNKAKAAITGRPRGTQVANSLANSNPPPQNPSLDFKQMLERKFDEAGFR